MKKRIGIIYNTKRKQNSVLAKKLERFLAKKGIKTSVCTAGPASDERPLPNGDMSLALILGGDGTLLSASRVLAPKGIPFLGINTGHLGFLTEGKGRNVIKLLQKVLKKKYKIEERAMLEAYIVINGKKKGPFYALNDAVINRSNSRKMVDLRLNVNQKPVADYVADGLIICTPTGSTAYALSAGGAVMDPEIKGIQIVPICAHTLTSRPHIISENKEITITFNKQYEGMTLQFDGQESFDLKHGVKIEIKTGRKKARLIRLFEKESDFYFRIRQKFHWGVASTRR